MATKKFGREPKMMTTEPSADLLKHEGMKKGGHAKKMAMGGNPMMADPRAMAMRKRMAMQPALLTRKKGGEVESSKEHKAEMAKMNKVEKELKHHEGMKASKAHHGLKAGGMYKPQMGGLLSEGKPHSKGMTGGIEGPGYKRGGKADGGGTVQPGTRQVVPRGGAFIKSGGKMAKGGTMPVVTKGGAQLKGGGLAAKGDAFQTKGTLKPKINVQDKVVEAKQTKSFNTKSGGIEGVGYKHGGKMHKFAKGGTVSQNVASRYLNNMNDGEKMPTKKGKTGEIKQSPAGYKHGGHVAMTCKAEGGFTVNKKMQKC
jgi:hypothetical protein